MRIALLLLFSLLSALGAEPAYVLKEDYAFSDRNVTFRTLFPEAHFDCFLLSIPPDKTRYRVKSSQIVDLMAPHNIHVDAGKVRYVNFRKRSPIDTSRIADAVREHYRQFYPDLSVRKIEVMPRRYLDRLPDDYEVEIPSRSHLRNEGILKLRTPDRRNLFFDYRLDADVTVITATIRLEREEMLTGLNTIRHSVRFDSFASLPLQRLEPGAYRTRYRLQADSVILLRSVEPMPVVRQGQSVVVGYRNGGVIVEFPATALQDGLKDDIIAVQKQNGERLKVRVSAPNRVELP